MNKAKPTTQTPPRQLIKVCLSCFGIAGAAVLASGILKMAVLNNHPKLEHIFNFLRPLSDGLLHIVQQALY